MEPHCRGEAMTTAEARVAAHPTVIRDESRLERLVPSGIPATGLGLTF